MIQKLQIIKMEDSKYQRLLQNQYKCIKADREQIQLTAKRLRDLLFKKDEHLFQPRLPIQLSGLRKP